MILRIKMINQIGRFANFKNGGSVVLGNATDNKNICVILGDNTYGKSTIADIIRSANDDNPLSIESRKTIPSTHNLSQAVELTYQEQSSPRPVDVSYKSSHWNNNVLKNRILVFDQEFVHANIFTGIDLTRENKENFTDFILGEEGTKLGTEIESRKKRANSFAKELREARPDFVMNETDDKKAENFINAEIPDSIEALEKTIGDQKKTLERLVKTSDFISLPAIAIVDDTYSMLHSQLSKELLSVCESSYDAVSSETMMQIREQLEHTDGAWLEKGTKFMTNDNCPFCTQDTSAVESLMNAYRAIYNENFDAYDRTLKESISSAKSMFSRLQSASISDEIGTSIVVIKKYLPFIGGLEQLSDILDSEIVRLRESESALKTFCLDVLGVKIDEFLTEKQNNIHKKAVIIDIKTAIEASKELIEAADLSVKSLYGLINKCSETIDIKRAEASKWTPDMIAAKSLLTNKVMTETEWKIKRLAQDVQCKNYNEIKTEQNHYKEATLLLQNQLQRQQSDYLKGLFSSINQWFRKLGSSDFTLEQKQSAKGNKTVYELRVNYCNQLIHEKNFRKVFSESDRRSLALAVFFARAEQRDKANTILLLDDPIVSFDDNRIANTCNELKRISTDFEQIIVLTHYKPFIKQLLQIKADALYAKLERHPDTFGLAPFETSDFLLSDHEKEYKKIASFAYGGSNDVACRAGCPRMSNAA